MNKITLVIFNESYWNKGLIYTQNIQPLLQLAKQEFTIEIISFTSVVLLFTQRKQIKKARKNLTCDGLKIKNFPVFFYPTRYMVVQYYMLFFYYVNVFFYFLFLNIKDCFFRENGFYSIRSYQAALGFLKFYKGNKKLIFDPRTDWITENINIGVFKKESRTVKFWRQIEKLILVKFYKSIFISDTFRQDLLERNNIVINYDKYPVVYNTIDYNLFENTNTDTNRDDFCYTGSLGHWNNLAIYLDFFKLVSPYFPNSRFRIYTGSPDRKVYPVLNKKKYDNIRHLVNIEFNVSPDLLSSRYAGIAYGLQIMPQKDTRVGVKFVEYIAAGILPIVSENVLGATFLSEKYNLGVVLRNNYKNNLEDLVNGILSKKIDRINQNYIEFKKITDLNQADLNLRSIYQ